MKDDLLGPFPLRDAAARLARLAAAGPLTRDPDGRSLRAVDPATGAPVRVRLPLLAPPLPADDPLPGPEALGTSPGGRELMVLVQAGASALGLWVDGALAAHKVVKKYVVRGHGKAQPLHLKTRGKSRLGSRLRLRNAEGQLEDTVAKAAEWARTLGPPDRLFYSCPVRTWAIYRPRLLEVLPPLEPVRIPTHVHVPDLAELKRVRGFLAWGRIEPLDYPAPGDEG